MSKDSRIITRTCIPLQTKLPTMSPAGKRAVVITNNFVLNSATIRSIKPQNKTMELMEKALTVWIEKHKNQYNTITNVRFQAIRIFNKIKKSNPSTASDANQFTANREWLEQFLKKVPLNHFELKKKPNSCEIVLDTNKTNEPKTKDNLNNNELENTSDIDLEIDCDNPVPKLNINILKEGFKLAKNLENYFLDNDPNMDRSLKFQRQLHNCLSQYEEICVELDVKKQPS